MITHFEVDLLDVTSTLMFVKQVINPGYEILILGCDIIQLFIVNAHSESLSSL